MSIKPGELQLQLQFRYQSPHGKTYLFVGDTLYPDNGEWKALFMSSQGGNGEVLKATLESLKSVQADVIIPSVVVGEHQIGEMTVEEWHAALDSAISSLD